MGGCFFLVGRKKSTVFALGIAVLDSATLGAVGDPGQVLVSVGGGAVMTLQALRCCSILAVGVLL